MGRMKAIGDMELDICGDEEGSEKQFKYFEKLGKRVKLGVNALGKYKEEYKEAKLEQPEERLTIEKPSKVLHIIFLYLNILQGLPHSA